MVRNTTAIIEFKQFYEREGRIPTVSEFVALGYTRQWFYKTRDLFYQIMNEMVNK